MVCDSDISSWKQTCLDNILYGFDISPGKKVPKNTNWQDNLYAGLNFEKGLLLKKLLLFIFVKICMQVSQSF